jgi:hypothetical protein
MARRSLTGFNANPVEAAREVDPAVGPQRRVAETDLRRAGAFELVGGQGQYGLTFAESPERCLTLVTEVSEPGVELSWQPAGASRLRSIPSVGRWSLRRATPATIPGPTAMASPTSAVSRSGRPSCETRP